MFVRICSLCRNEKVVRDKESSLAKYCNVCKYSSSERNDKISNAKTGKNHHFYGKILSKSHKRKIGIGNKGKTVSLEVRKKISRSSLGKKGTRNGVKLSNEIRKKIRLGGIEAYKRKHSKNLSPRINPDACAVFDMLESKFNLNGIYGSKSGKEFFVKNLGYWVDYYEPKLNLVIEYYERHHNRPVRRIKDKKRIKELRKELNCKLLIISEHETLNEIVSRVSKYISE